MRLRLMGRQNSEAAMRGDQNIWEGMVTQQKTFIHLSFRKTGMKKREICEKYLEGIYINNKISE